MLETILRLAADPIPNIRFNVAKTLEVVGSFFNDTDKSGKEGKELVSTKVAPVLRTLEQDGDADVRYFAGKALERTVVV